MKCLDFSDFLRYHLRNSCEKWNIFADRNPNPIWDETDNVIFFYNLWNLIRNFVELIGMSNDGFHNFQRREIYFYKGSWYVKWRTLYFVKKVASSTVRLLILKIHVLEDHVRESQGSKLAFSKGRVWYGQIYSISRARGHLTYPRAEILFQSGKFFFISTNLVEETL